MFCTASLSAPGVAGCKPSILDVLSSSYTNFSATLFTLRESQVVSTLTVPHKLLQLAITQVSIKSETHVCVVRCFIPIHP